MGAPDAGPTGCAGCATGLSAAHPPGTGQKKGCWWQAPTRRAPATSSPTRSLGRALAKQTGRL